MSEIEFFKNVTLLPKDTHTEKVGQWIYGEDNLGGTGRDGWYCNQCGHFEFWDYSMDIKSARLNLPNLCPNCYCKMQKIKEVETMGPYEKAIYDIDDIMSEIELPNKEDLITEFRSQTIEELENNFIFMVELLHHINDTLDKIGGI